MPLHIYIDINDNPLDRLHIARIQGGVNPDDVNTYIAVVGEEPLFRDDWIKRGAEFKHRYGDGALVCVRKALEALEKKDALTELNGRVRTDLHHCGYDFEVWKPTATCRCGAVATNPFYINKEEK